MEEGPTIGARLSCVTFKPAVQASPHFLELDDSSKGIEHIELKKMKESSFFHFRKASKAIIESSQGSALKDLDVSCRS